MAVSTSDNVIPKRKRINCRNCGYRILADAHECLHCHADPHQWRLKWLNAVLLVVGALLFIYIGVLVIRVFPFAMPTAPRLDPTNASTRLPTLTFVAQAIIDTPTLTPITLPPTLPPSATPIATSRFTVTPTRRGAPTSTPTLATATPKLADYAAPKLTAPLNAAIFSGGDASIVLEWESISVRGLRENEWYLISVSYSSRIGPTVRTEWSREIRWTVKKDLWSDAAPSARTFAWNIQVMRTEGANPYASSNNIPASPVSDTFKFVWQ